MPVLVEEMFELFAKLKQQGLTILLVEQNAMGALKIADRGLILNLGRLVGSGTASELLHDPHLRSAYLGF